MTLEQMGCCAFNEIRHLSQHRSAPEAMREFCRQTFQEFAPGWKVGAFYIFTAVVKGGTAGTYGENFAKLIEKNKLGEVVVTMVRTNRRNAPSHHIQGWVWAPNEKNLKAWWRKNGGAVGV